MRQDSQERPETHHVRKFPRQAVQRQPAGALRIHVAHPSRVHTRLERGQEQYACIRGGGRPPYQTLLASMDDPYESSHPLDHEQPPAAVDSKTPWYNISPDLARYTPQEIGYGYRDGPYAGDGYRKLPEELYEGSVQVGLPRLPQPVFIGYLPPRVRLWRKNARDGLSAQ